MRMLDAFHNSPPKVEFCRAPWRIRLNALEKMPENQKKMSEKNIVFIEQKSWIFFAPMRLYWRFSEYFVVFFVRRQIFLLLCNAKRESSTEFIRLMYIRSRVVNENAEFIFAICLFSTIQPKPKNMHISIFIRVPPL